MEDDAAEATQSLSADIDICQQLLTRYARSSAAQHRHLCATAAATRSIIQSSTLPLTAVSYFAATITSLSNSKDLDTNALGALTSFISIVLPLVNKCEIKPEKAREAVRVLVETVEESGGKLGTSGVRAVVKSVGVLVAEFCNLKEWDSLALGFEWLLKFSLDKRPKVRKCAQDCLFKIFKYFESSAISKKASKSIYSLLKDHMPLAIEMSTSEIVKGTKHEAMSKPENQDVLHLLNVMKHVVQHLSPKVRTKMLSQLLKLISSQFSVLTGHVLDVISAIFATSDSDTIISNAEGIFSSIVSYMSLGEKNPVDSVLFAANLAKTALGRLHNGDINEWASYFPMLIEPLTGLLVSKDNISLQSATILRELIDKHIDGKSFLPIENQENKDMSTHSAEFKAIETSCTALYGLLGAPSPELSEHFFSVVSLLFLKLGKMSEIFMKPILLKLADLMNNTSSSTIEVKHLEDCIGSAVAAMGPEILLSLIPISLSTKDFSCSNVWLIPILKKNIIGSSLQFFMEHIVPLAESFEKGSRKVKKSVIGKDLQAYAHGCWGLLPAFCRWPSDTYKTFASLSKLLIPFLKKDSFMLENIAIGLEELVNKNRLASDCGSLQLTEVQSTEIVNEFAILETRHVYSRKMASKNMKALALCSEELLQALINVLLESPPERRKTLKGAIGCLASICDPSVTKQIFIASLKKFQLLDDIGEHENLASDADGLAKEKESSGTDPKRCLILELASCIVEGSNEDLVNLLLSVTQRAMQESNEVGQMEAYQTLSRIFEKHSGFSSSQFDVVMDLLTGMKSTANMSNIMLIKSRFTCLQTVLVHALTRNMDEENTKTFHILNEIILTLKDSNEEGRKVAYDALHGISSKLRSSTDASSDGLYHKLVIMITGYLSGSSPHIKSGVVSALSVLIYSDPIMCITMPEVVPSVMELLHSKSIEIIKAVLGFVKVLVSCLPPIDLHHFLSDIMDGVLRWSSVSRHHFKTKIVVILEIMIRKCGTAKVKALAPEKYKDFVQDVVENRHGKSSSREAGNRDSNPDGSDSSLKGQQKRKWEESVMLSKEEEGSTGPWKKKRDRDHSAHSDQANLKKGKWTKPRGGDSRDLKKQKERTVFKKNNEKKLQRGDVASKPWKHKKGGS